MLRPPPIRPGETLRALMASGTVTMPGVYNALTAVLAERAGFGAAYISGGATTNAHLAAPDIALIGLDEMAATAARCCQAVRIPIVSDADTGFGDVWNVSRCVFEMERAGLAGIHIEDQVMPKRCGHLAGKVLVDASDMALKIRAAIDSKSDSSFLVIARTDARGVEGLNAAIDRARSYADAGADAIFPEGLTSEAEFSEFRDAVPIPLLANMTEFGQTPLIPVARFQELGYQLVIFPVTALRVTAKAVSDFYAYLAANGSQAGYLDKMVTRKELYEIVGYEEYERTDAAWAELKAR